MVSFHLFFISLAKLIIIYLPWCAVLDNCVESIKSNFILPHPLIKLDTGMLKLVAPKYLTWQVGGSYLSNGWRGN